MALTVQFGRVFESACHDGNLGTVIAFPEKRGPANRTETATRKIRCGVPGDFIQTRNPDVLVFNVGCGVKKPRLLAALRAVTVNDATQASICLEVYGAAIAGTRIRSAQIYLLSAIRNPFNLKHFFEWNRRPKSFTFKLLVYELL
jgi:hypothetical protein